MHKAYILLSHLNVKFLVTYDNSFVFVIRHQLAYLKTIKKENGLKFRINFMPITDSY